jgi:putative glycerol-1-phosphate prenyltransferase
MTKNIYLSATQRKKNNKKALAILVDPDKSSNEALKKISEIATKAHVDYFFVGGSLLTHDNLENSIKILKENSNIPVVLFPGNTLQISKQADAILFLSLISGRNPEMLIGRHVISAPYLKSTDLEVISTGYMLIDCGKPTSVTYMSNSTPIPGDKDDIAVCTAMAGEMLGLKLIYMDAGSGADNTISATMVKKVSQSIDVPLIVGGGIRNKESVREILDAGADIIVVGNAAEKSPNLIFEISEEIHR